MHAEAVIHREEVVGILFVITDMNVSITWILELLEEELGGEGEVPQDDA